MKQVKVPRGEMNLLPCPWCGAKRYKIAVNDYDGHKFVECYNCAATGPHNTETETAEQQWNRRDYDAAAALDDELTVMKATLETFDSPAQALARLIEWHVEVATDPAVNGGYILTPQRTVGEPGDKIRLTENGPTWDSHNGE